jgi:hypothetical protein
MNSWHGGQAGPSGTEGIESDDEGDLFRAAYLKGVGSQTYDHDAKPQTGAR